MIRACREGSAARSICDVLRWSALQFDKAAVDAAEVKADYDKLVLDNYEQKAQVKLLSRLFNSVRPEPACLRSHRIVHVHVISLVRCRAGRAGFRRRSTSPASLAHSVSV
jgi:hypothetical protein